MSVSYIAFAYGRGHKHVSWSV